ncbi:hypothetical protein KDA_76050 [Dictyobacter alpinus]|uniref:Asparagine synthetase domain-containing protein n=1 Tax=Dictyobacter alpinus TaxID=2014873 RepID=A0A402BL99_9CHLR|nr:asparagine synthase C-terminal domain-containing protein [Dictyobacter alpinus]GCE32121.1 hypothetical protein KDA_76050 [Dictyobacter alpinus]
MKPEFLSTYTGFCGQLREASTQLTTACWKVGSPGPPLLGKNGAIQWVSSLQGEEDYLLPSNGGQVYLAGLIWNEKGSKSAFAQTLCQILQGSHFQQLATLVETSAGCYIDTTNTVYLWVGFAASNESVFYRIDNTQLRWSTDPLDLVYEESEIDLWALRRCCHGDDVFIYPQLRRVEQGHLVKITPDRRVTTYQFDRFLPDPHLTARRATIELFVQATQVALQRAMQPLARTTLPIGIMLSGGVGSAALLSVLKQEQVPVIAYHLESPDPAGSEYAFAKMTCEALKVPLQRIEMDTGPQYLSSHGEERWIHPYGHPWARWYQQLAQQAHRDGVRLLVTGGGDDSSFGPELEYSVYAVLSAPMSWREKATMILGMLSTDWNVFDLVRSAWPLPPRQLIGPSSAAGHTSRDRTMRKADFLVPLPPRPRALDDAAVIHAPRFAAQSLAIGQVLEQQGIHLYYPYHDRCVQAISLALPPPYRLIPRLGPLLHRSDIPDQLMNKPVLRLACEKMLPEAVTWRTWSVYTQAPIQQFCLNHPQRLNALLGVDSSLARLGIADPSRLALILSQRALIRENYQTLVASGMVEIFLQQWKRGGPVWE